MNTKPMLEQSDIEALLMGARGEAEKNGWKVSIAVVDDGGHLLGLMRLDGAPPSTVRVADEKARTAALTRRESKVYEDMINGGRHAFLSAPLVATLEGGLPILADAECVGAIGVSGVKSDQDAEIAKAGVACLNRMIG